MLRRLLTGREIWLVSRVSSLLVMGVVAARIVVTLVMNIIETWRERITILMLLE